MGTDLFGEMLKQRAQTWANYAAQRETNMGTLPKPYESTVLFETAPERDARRRQEYEAWIVASRKKARHERIMRRFAISAFVLLGLAVLFALFVWVNQACAAPTELRPTEERRGHPPVVEPSPTPRKGLSRAEAEAQCIKAGGFWHVDEEPEGLPGREVIGCLWAVPKGWK